MTRPTCILLALFSMTFAACAADGTTTSTDGTGNAGPELRVGEAFHPASDLVWRRCPVGMDWESGDCAGVPSTLTFEAAEVACGDLDPAYRLPSLGELGSLLGHCTDDTEGARCQPCRNSEDCTETLAAEDISEWTWTADDTTDGPHAFVVEISDGRIAYEEMSTADVQARCVRPWR